MVQSVRGKRELLGFSIWLHEREWSNAKFSKFRSASGCGGGGGIIGGGIMILRSNNFIISAIRETPRIFFFFFFPFKLVEAWKGTIIDDTAAVYLISYHFAIYYL